MRVTIRPSSSGVRRRRAADRIGRPTEHRGRRAVPRVRDVLLYDGRRRRGRRRGDRVVRAVSSTANPASGEAKRPWCHIADERRDRRTHADRAAGRRDGAARTTTCRWAPTASSRITWRPAWPRHAGWACAPVFYGAYSRPGLAGRHFPALGLAGRTLEAVVSDLAADWMRQGFTRVLVLNGHWENS